MAPNEVWNLQVRGTMNETQHIHGLHFLENAPVDPTGAGLIAAYSGAPLTAYRNIMSGSVGWRPVEMIQAQKVCGSVPLPSATQVVPTLANQAGLRGTGAGDPMPAFLACLVNLKGVNAGRRYSGRFFLGGLWESDCALNQLSTAYIALVQAYCDALKAAFVTPTLPEWRLFNFSNLLADGDPGHTKRNPVPGGARISDPVTAVPCQQAGSAVSNLIVSTRPTTMRSRKYGHGL